MSYRSDVRIALKKTTFEQLNALIKEKAKSYYQQDEDNNKWAKEYAENGVSSYYGVLEDAPHDDEVILYFESIKWDTYYKDIKWIYDGLEELTSQGLGYIIVSIGEDGATETSRNFDMWDYGNVFDKNKPLSADNVQPIKTRMYAETVFKIQ